MPEWLEILDLEQAVKNVRTDIFGDWHRDPWDWPEHEWLLSENGRREVLDSLAADGVRRTVSLDVPKENFSTRPALIFDPVDRLVYQTLVDRISRKLLSGLPHWVYSWRLSRKSPKPGHYRDMRAEWKGYRQRLSKLSAFYNSALTTDIVSFFPSIPIDRLIDTIVDVSGGSHVVDRLSSMLTDWDQISGRGGLPMRANASCVLAAMYLRPIDDILREYGRNLAHRPFGFMRNAIGEGPAVRWVDDIWLFGDNRVDLRSAQMDLQGVLRSLGLNMNLAKTDVLEGDEMMQRAREIEHSSIDIALMDDQDADFEPMNALLDRVISSPEHANHTSVRFVTVRMRNHKKFDRLDELISVAERMPHASDAIARTFSDAKRYLDLEDWFVDYLRSRWSRMELAAAQLARMFPSSVQPSAKVVDALVEKALSGCSVPLLSLTVQRMAAWHPNRARAFYRELATKADNPHARRLLAFGALNAGEGRNWIIPLLSEFSENRVTLEFLRDRNFVPVPAGGDFVGF